MPDVLFGLGLAATAITLSTAYYWAVLTGRLNPNNEEEES